MATFLGWVAILALSATLVSTIATIWMEKPSAPQFLELTRALLSWQVIAGGLTFGAGGAFRTQLSALLTRLAR